MAHTAMTIGSFLQEDKMDIQRTKRDVSREAGKGGGCSERREAPLEIG